MKQLFLIGLIASSNVFADEISDYAKTAYQQHCAPLMQHIDEVENSYDSAYHGNTSLNIAEAQVENQQEGIISILDETPLPYDAYDIFAIDEAIKKIVFSSKNDSTIFNKFRSAVLNQCVEDIAQIDQDRQQGNTRHDYSKD